MDNAFQPDENISVVQGRKEYCQRVLAHGSHLGIALGDISRHLHYCVSLFGGEFSFEKHRLRQKAVLKGPQNIRCDVMMTESGPSAAVLVKMGKSSLVEDLHLLFLLPRLWHEAPV